MTDYITANYVGATLEQAGTKTDSAGAITQCDVKFTLNGKSYEADFDATGKFLKLN